MLTYPLPDLAFRLARGSDRRVASRTAALPFITEEGLVLVDRRSNQERRRSERPKGKAGSSLPAAA